MDHRRFLEGMALLTATFPLPVSAKVAEDRAGAYLIGCADLTDADWEKAIRAAIRQEKFFPPVARLRELAGPSELAVKSAAAEKFAKLFDGHDWIAEIPRAKLLDRLGAAGYQALVSAGGPRAFDNATDRDRPFLEKRFIEAYAEAETELRRTGTLPAVESMKALPAPVKQLVAGVGQEMPK